MTEIANFYHSDFYPPIAGFGPRINNGRPRQFHRFGGMNYDEVKRLIHYVTIPAESVLGRVRDDPNVLLDTIIQNTPLVILEASRLVSSRSYLAALQLLQAQQALLDEYGRIHEDTAIDEDIELLARYYDIVFEQARATNLLQ